MRGEIKLILQRQKHHENKTINRYMTKNRNLEEMDKFLETYKLPRMSQKEIDNLNKLISEDEFVV